VGEPVTEEMLASVERMCGVEYFPGDDVRAIVAEVRRLRVEVTIAREAAKSARGLALESAQQPTAGELAAANLAAHAAGYARAERDVVAFTTSAIDHDDKRVKAATQRGDGARANVYAAGHTALSLARKRIEDHCHRGAAKDEAPRGEEE
jgi:hypothetical protein